eukprot:4669625-Prymnesium_polylepis.1
MHLHRRDHRQHRRGERALGECLGDLFKYLDRAESVAARAGREQRSDGCHRKKRRLVRIAQRRHPCVTMGCPTPSQQSISTCLTP